MSKALIDNSYINEKTCAITENNTERKTSHILETAHTHDTEYNKKKGLNRKKYRYQ